MRKVKGERGKEGEGGSTSPEAPSPYGKSNSSTREVQSPVDKTVTISVIGGGR